MGRPNVVMIVIDDMGFSDLGCYGSEIATPNMDALAEQGLRYNSFHATSLCAPTRACLLTGRNHHAVGMGVIPELSSELPGYTGRIPESAGTLPQLLVGAGYNTFAVGKWHLTPSSEEGAAGPFSRWPLGMGFERFYGFIGGATNQWTPNLVWDNEFVEPHLTPRGGYHLTEDLATRAIRFVQDQQEAAPGRPFFLHFATGAVHSPHHVSDSWIDAYQHRYDGGWETVRGERFLRQQELGVVPPDSTLTARPSWVTPWEELSGDERRLYARQMQVYAGFLSHTDAQIGRLLDFLGATGILDDTIVMVLSDNGASAEGGPNGWTNPVGFGRTEGDGSDLESRLARIDELGGFTTFDLYSWGWAWAGNTPFKLWKRYAWLGGVRVPLIVRWGTGIPAGENGRVRSQFCHAIDLMPTILDALGVDPPDVLADVPQQPIDGESLVATFADEGAPSPRTTQYFEVFGSRSIYHDGWKATTDHVHHAMGAERDLLPGSHDFATDEWSLYFLPEDFSEACDQATAHPERLQQMIELWWHEAERNQVLPLVEASGSDEDADDRPDPGLDREWQCYVLPPDGGPMVSPSLGDGFRVLADIELPRDERTEGVLCAQGDWNGGWACYFLKGRLVLTFNVGGAVTSLATPEPVEPGPHEVEIAYVPGPSGEGVAHIDLDGVRMATAPLPCERIHLEPISYYGRLLVGRDRGFPVCRDYEPPFPFSGEIHRFRFVVPAASVADARPEASRLLRD